jgi:iron complex outermembrane receptor protein
MSASVGESIFHLRGKLGPFLLVLCCAKAQAQVSLGDIEVEGLRLPKPMVDLPNAYVLDQETIAQERAQGRDLSQILERAVPGMGPSSGTATSFTQTVRGRTPLLLIDGIPQSSNRAIHRDFLSVDPDQIERIEVMPQATALYGAGAAGGIINIITKKAAKEGFHAKTRLGYSAFPKHWAANSGQYDVNQSFYGKKNRLFYQLDLGFTRNMRLLDADGEVVPPDPAQTSLNDSTIGDIQGKIGYDLSDSKRLTLNAQRYSAKQDSDYAPYYGGVGVPAIARRQMLPNPAVKGLKLDDEPYTERWFVHLDYTDAALWGMAMESQLFWRQEEFRFFPFPNRLPTIAGEAIGSPQDLTLDVASQSTNRTDVYGFRSTLKKAFDVLGRSASISGGVDVQRDENEAQSSLYDFETFSATGGLRYEPTGYRFPYSPPVDTTTEALFFQLNTELVKDLSFNAGLRYENTDISVKSYVPFAENVFYAYGYQPNPAVLSGGDLGYDAFLPNAGLDWTFLPRQHLFFNYAQGFEQPDVSRLLRNALPQGSLALANGGGLPTEVSESQLGAIKTNAFELGWKGGVGMLDTLISVFYNQSNKTVLFDGTIARLTDQKKRFYGVDASADVYIDAHWTLRLGGGWIHGETEMDGRWVALDAWEAPPPKIFTSLVWDTARRYRFSLDVLHIFDDRDAWRDGNSYGVPIEGYTTVDLLASARLSEKGTFNIGVANLFNESYDSVYSQQAVAYYGSFSAFPGLGRQLTMSVNYQW